LGKGGDAYEHEKREEYGMSDYDPEIAFLLGDLSLRVYFEVILKIAVSLRC
jgi:hypothetical protein